MDVLKVIKRNPLIFPMACVAVAAMVFISEGSYMQSSHTLDRLGAMAVVPTSLQQLQWGIVDIEAAQKSTPAWTRPTRARSSCWPTGMRRKPSRAR